MGAEEPKRGTNCPAGGQRVSASDAALTPLRREVLALVAASVRPIKAYELLDQLRVRRGRAAPPTVYRALAFLLDAGVVHRIESLNAFVACTNVGEACRAMFLLCDTCGSAMEMNDHGCAEAVSSVADRAAFTVHSVTQEVRGRCSSCDSDVSSIVGANRRLRRASLQRMT